MASDAQLNEDSLRREIRSTKQDSTKVKIYLEWDSYIYHRDYRLDIELNERVVYLCKKNLEEKQLSKREKNFFEKFLSIAHNNIGLALSNQDLYPEALANFQKSLKIAEQRKDTQTISNVYNNIGIVYWNKKEFVKAEKYLGKSIAIAEKKGDKSGKAEMLNNLGLVYKDQDLFDKAMESFTTCMEMINYDSSIMVMPNALTNIGLLYYEHGDYQVAMHYFNRANKLFTALEAPQGKGDTEVAIGKTYGSLEQYGKACEHCQTALEIGKKDNIITIVREANKCLYVNNRKAGNIKAALEYHENYVNLKDSMAALSGPKELERVELRYEYENKEAAQKLIMEGERKAATERSKHEETQRYFLYGGLILVLAFAGFMFNRFKVSQRQKKIIEKQQKETTQAKVLVEEKNKEILDSINYAKRLQDAILPSHRLLDKYFAEHFILYLPKDIVAGDFYWLETRGDQLFFTVADCTGHGVPGAMVSVVCSNALNHAIGEFGLNDPGRILDKVRELVLNTFESKGTEVKDGMDISLFTLSLSSLALKWSGANNPLWYRKAGEEEIHEIRADKQPVGRYAVEKPFTTHELQLQKGDTLYLYTDGYPDQFGGEKGKKLKALYMKKLLMAVRSKNLSEQGKYMHEAFEKWKGNLEQIDDVCVAGIKL
ncbi:MAG: tetratricopeptide repeat protein [Flavobacteriales bacterium]